jgi:hypothetical protein
MTLYRRVIAPFIACSLLAILAYLVFQLARPFLAAGSMGLLLWCVEEPLPPVAPGPPPAHG